MSHLQEELRSAIYKELFQKYSHYNIPASTAGIEIKEGMSGAAVRTAIHRKTFPLPTKKVMGTQMVRLTDLAAFLADPSTTFPSTTFNDGEPETGASEIEKRGRGQRGPGKRRLLNCT